MSVVTFILIESLLTGTPIVGTDVGGMPDLITDPGDGTLVPRGNAEALYPALIEVLERPPARAEISSRAADRFDLLKMGEAHLRLIRELTGG